MPKLPIARDRFDAVTFDVDGTLYPLPLQRAFLLPYLAMHPLLLGNYNAVVQEVRTERVRSTDLRGEVARRLGERVGANADRARQVINQVIHGAWPSTFSPRTPYGGIAELLAAIDAAGIPRSVVSDYPAERKLANMGLESGWTAVIDCEGLGAYKPQPDGLLAAAQAMEVDPSRVLHIGDRADTDGAMADEAGAACVLIGEHVRRPKALLELFA
ncbi:MAG: HAD family hydrolase [Proteobacteria bacterium]|nr:HAD family hydrolase [Pseudomonadota bacterium]MCP4919448.1 HAD family hydrolase [Pseudomonadota bacterium]